MSFTKIQTKSPQIRLWSSGTLLLCEYVSNATVESLEEVSKAQQAIVAAHGKVSSLQFVSGELGKVDDAVKKKAAEMTKMLEKQTVGSAVVMPGNSLSAMMIRTVVTGINMMSRSTSPTKCYATITEALSWLQSLPTQDPAVKKITTKDVEDTFGAKAKAA